MAEETLKEILEQTKKEARFSRLLAFIMGGILAVVLIAAVILVPQLVGLMTRISQTAANAQELMQSASTTLTEVSGALSGVSTMTESITKTSGTLFEGLTAVDFNALSTAITDLQAAVAPLADLSRLLTGQ
ncbi:MAG: hypothetical protein IJQ12_02795 [Lachnospiraceae bacterium]|nr:hypothetical protein [Lachnospiraceae bacterium]